MSSIQFVKSQGIGNDFVIVDCLRQSIDDTDVSELAVRLCDRHFGIGGDGLILVLPSEKADYRMRIINSDGSEPEMCGNGIRCFGRYLYNRGLAGDSFTVETLAGIMKLTVAHMGDDVQFTVNMGAPCLDAQEIPIAGYVGQVVAESLDVGGSEYEITCVSMGNPHCIIFAGPEQLPLEDLPLESIGPKIETHSAFPKKTNVEFAEVLNDHEINVRVWERGAGITLACGTGACATVVAGVLNGKVGRKTTVHLPGGDLLVDWREDGNIYMTGPAEEVFTGEIAV